MTLSAMRRLISRAVVRVAMLKFVVFILRMSPKHIVRRANNMLTLMLCQEVFSGMLARGGLEIRLLRLSFLGD